MFASPFILQPSYSAAEANGAQLARLTPGRQITEFALGSVASPTEVGLGPENKLCGIPVDFFARAGPLS